MKIAALFATVLLLGACTMASAEEAGALHVTIPAGFDPAKTTVVVGQYPEGLNLGQATWDKTIKQFTIPLVSRVKSARVLIYYPGYKLVAVNILPDKLSEPFAATFEKLPVVALTIKLTGSDEQPIGGQLISLRQTPVDMEYFNYHDGMIVGSNAAPVASGMSDADGNLFLYVPLLLDDPLYEQLKIKPAFSVQSDWKSPSGMNDYNLVPNSIDAQKKYASPISIKLVYRGTITGKVTQPFLTNHQIDAQLGKDESGIYRIWFEVDTKDGKSGQGVAPAADGSFSISVAPGIYNLSIQVRDDQGNVTKSVPVAKSFVLGENETQTIDLK